MRWIKCYVVILCGVVFAACGNEVPSSSPVLLEQFLPEGELKSAMLRFDCACPKQTGDKHTWTDILSGQQVTGEVQAIDDICGDYSNQSTCSQQSCLVRVIAYGSYFPQDLQVPCVAKAPGTQAETAAVSHW